MERHLSSCHVAVQPRLALPCWCAGGAALPELSLACHPWNALQGPAAPEPDSCVHVPYQIACSCAAQEALQLLASGLQNRRVGETRAHRESSRSHCIFTCCVESMVVDEDGTTTSKRACLNLVDLAGGAAGVAAALYKWRVTARWTLQEGQQLTGPLWCSLPTCNAVPSSWWTRQVGQRWQSSSAPLVLPQVWTRQVSGAH